MTSSKLVLFQDYKRFLEQESSSSSSTINNNEFLSPSEVFFELANQNTIGYQIRKNIITIQQTNTVGTHTGGIVWETSYLLANYLVSFIQQQEKRGGRVLEVGSGCGMLGLILAATNVYDMVVLTETTDVLSNLQQNVKANYHTSRSKKRKTIVHTKQLRWDELQSDVDDVLQESSFDIIVGTDVIFTPILVRPLLQTLRYMSHDTTIIYICVQIRCQESHTLFLNQAKQYNFEIKDISNHYHTIPSCTWGKELDCILFQLTTLLPKQPPPPPQQQHSNSNKKTKTKKKQKKQKKKRKRDTTTEIQETNHCKKTKTKSI